MHRDNDSRSLFSHQRSIVGVFALSLVVGACNKTTRDQTAADVEDSEPTGSAVTNACALPTVQASTPEETAWQLFVAANCPTGDAARPLAFESWTEQSCIAQPSAAGCEKAGSTRSLHGSHFLAKSNPQPESGQPNFVPCGGMNTTSPFSPTTGPGALVADPKFCEEVYVNEAELTYLRAPAPSFSLTTHTDQAAFMNAGHTIDTPKASVEVKVDWLPASSLKTPFTCDAPPEGVFVEEVDGECYAMAGMHLSSKLYTHWLWATFEPQSNVTNPNRCRADLYGECRDSWGATPTTNGLGTKTETTAHLKKLMTSAKLAVAFKNYRLTGVQTTFTDGATVTNGGKTYEHNLGSSFVEFNAQVSPGQASCITCHASAQLDPTNVTEQSLQETTGPYPHGGVQFPAAAPYQTQDFSWLLGQVLD